ncbi:Uma2 family endonuclease [Nostoc sp. FACHB-110]|uniref:Uma2 family endonuclease n=1 Tax=Nostoc sp. FACHB-110 TaxID=2692834 RepID=UPI0016858064|nr:Uma2 family endonuclease [Nostoc sp. FACHB-110]MBD2435319.1 Uma2 family endonuclease [Nostoc sp. FACHB-110]
MAASNLKVPPLESGDRLTRQEFEHRYHAMPNTKKAELIEGVVYIASPLRFKSHGKPHGNLIIWLGTYKVSTPGVELGDNSTVRLDLDNEVQPDVVLLIDEQLGGQTRITEDDYIEGAPELIAEVAASSAANDLYDKKRVYRRNGVKEYIVWQVFDNKLDWFVLENGDYITLNPDTNGIIKSRTFPGLWLELSALLTGEMTQVLAVLQQGVASEAHQLFIQQISTHS